MIHVDAHGVKDEDKDGETDDQMTRDGSLTGGSIQSASGAMTRMVLLKVDEPRARVVAAHLGADVVATARRLAASREVLSSLCVALLSRECRWCICLGYNPGTGQLVSCEPRWCAEGTAAATRVPFSPEGAFRMSQLDVLGQAGGAFALGAAVRAGGRRVRSLLMRKSVGA